MWKQIASRVIKLGWKILWTQMIFQVEYPLVMTNITIENGPVEIVDLPIQNGDVPVRKL